MTDALLGPTAGARGGAIGAVLSLALLLAPAPARADSDGCYCAGPDYVAFAAFRDGVPRIPMGRDGALTRRGESR